MLQGRPAFSDLCVFIWLNGGLGNLDVCPDSNLNSIKLNLAVVLSIAQWDPKFDHFSQAVLPLPGISKSQVLERGSIPPPRKVLCLAPTIPRAPDLKIGLIHQRKS